jgi:hypothetical protein
VCIGIAQSLRDTITRYYSNPENYRYSETYRFSANLRDTAHLYKYTYTEIPYRHTTGQAHELMYTNTCIHVHTHHRVDEIRVLPRAGKAAAVEINTKTKQIQK